MKKLVTLLTLVLVVFGLSAATVYVGGEVGLNTNSIIAGKGYSGYTFTPSLGCSLTVPVVVEFTPSLGLQTGVTYVKKSYDYDKTLKIKGQEETLFKYNCENGFVEIPVAFRYSLNIAGSRWNAFATVGGFIGFWTDGERAGEAYGSTSGRSVDEKTDLSLYNRFQAGVSASAGVDVEFGTMEAYLSFGYSLTLTSLNKSQKHASYPVHNSTFTVAAGLLWGIDK